MKDRDLIRKGLTVYGPNNESLGTVDEVDDQGIIVGGTRIPDAAIARADRNGVYLSNANFRQGYQGAYKTGTNTQGAYQQNQNEMRVPVVEEQLNVGKQATQYGEAQIRKTVSEEQQTVPVELRREEVNIEEHDIPDRPLRPDEANAAFREGTMRVPLRAEEAVVNKQAVVTGEVAINKNVETEQRQVSDTVRKEHVDVDKNVTRDREAVNRTYQTTDTNYNAATADTNRGYTSANYEAATAASGSYGQRQIQQGVEVYGSNDDYIGRVKEVTGQTFLVDRTMQRDVYVPMSAVQNMDGDQVVLNLPADEVDNQGWDNPPLTGGRDY